MGWSRITWLMEGFNNHVITNPRHVTLRNDDRWQKYGWEYADLMLTWSYENTYITWSLSRCWLDRPSNVHVIICKHINHVIDSLLLIGSILWHHWRLCRPAILQPSRDRQAVADWMTRVRSLASFALSAPDQHDHRPWTTDYGLLTLGLGLWSMNYELRTMDLGPWTVDYGLRITDHETWT